MLRRAGDWFVHSGIQEPNGGVARYYRADLGKNARISTEITGYAVSTLLYIADRTGDSEYREAGLRAARFLTRTAWEAELSTFPFEYSANGDQPKALSYFFDCGIIVRGLLGAWRVTGDSEFLDRATAAARSMIADFQTQSAIHPIVSLPARQPLPYEPKWSAQPGCYQLKSAMAWQELFEETGDQPFREAYEQALEAALQNGGEFLPGDENPGKVMDRLHAFAYFLEGLLPCAGRPECTTAMIQGIAAMGHYLTKIAPQFARSDVYAQLLRVRLYAAQAGVVPLDETAAGCEAARAAEFQLESDDPRVEGGFAFGRRGRETLPFVNPVSTGFCAQALALWSDYKTGSLNPLRHALV